MKPLRTITAVLATSVLVGGAASPALAQTAADYPTDQPSTTEAKKPGKKGRHAKKQRMLSDAQLTTVATKLGTTLEPLKAAQASVKAAIDATAANETKAERDALLATALGVTVDQLRAAFAGVRGTTDGKCKPRSGSTAGAYPTDGATGAS